MATQKGGEGPKQPSERTFGQRYLKALGLYNLVKDDPAYAPQGNALITESALRAHLDEVKAVNERVADLTPAYNDAQDERVALYHGPKGLIKRAATVREVIAGLKGGKGSTAHRTVQRLVQEMTAYQKPPKEVADGTDPVPGRSQTQTSFGSLLQKGREVLGVIKGLGTAYVTSNALVTAEAFEELLATAEAQDTVVSNALKPLNEAKRTRRKLLDDPDNGLKARIAAVKSYVAGNVEGGKQSTLYKELVKVRYR